jgi:hypothetical protein
MENQVRMRLNYPQQSCCQPSQCPLKYFPNLAASAPNLVGERNNLVQVVWQPSYAHSLKELEAPVAAQALEEGQLRLTPAGLPLLAKSSAHLPWPLCLVLGKAIEALQGESLIE